LGGTHWFGREIPNAHSPNRRDAQIVGRPQHAHARPHRQVVLVANSFGEGIVPPILACICGTLPVSVREPSRFGYSRHSHLMTGVRKPEATNAQDMNPCRGSSWLRRGRRGCSGARQPPGRRSTDVAKCAAQRNQQLRSRLFGRRHNSARRCRSRDETDTASLRGQDAGDPATRHAERQPGTRAEVARSGGLCCLDRASALKPTLRRA
jgi:hypothetical protein